MAEAEADVKFSYFTHGTGAGRRAHVWRYLGKSAQAYMCMECELRVTKIALKAATDG